MVFSSSLFLLYFLPVFLIIYFLLGKKLKNIFALIASIFFYAWGAPDFIFIVLGSIIIDYYIVELLNKSIGKRKNILLALSVLLNVGLLVYFKYANFFIDNINEILTRLGSENVRWTEIALPIGISFFTFLIWGANNFNQRKQNEKIGDVLEKYYEKIYTSSCEKSKLYKLKK